MRATLNIDVDVLVAVKKLAARQNKTAGQVLSALVRKVLTDLPDGRRTARRSGFRPFASRGRPVTNALIDKLRNETGS